MTTLDPLTVYDVLKHLVDNEGAGFIDVDLAEKLSRYVPDSFDDFVVGEGAATK